MGTTRVSRAAVGVVALLLTGVLAGCNDEDAPDPQGPIESSSEPSSSPTGATSEPTPRGPVEPTLPAEAEENDQAGAEAYVRFYWDVVNFATKTGDVGLLEQLDQPSCDGCARGVEGIERVYGGGGRITGGNYKVTSLEPTRSPSGHWTVVAHTRIGTQRTVGAGDLNGRFPGGRAKWLLGVAWIHDAWSITTLEGL
jgi:hypothetical protein